jgi:glycine/D-amino acid oxidase-like deaminating enzyme
MSTRRQFLSAALVGLTAKAEKRIDGGFVNESFPAGHRLRDRATFVKPPRREKIPLVIVGGGMAGLSAAWRLDKKGFRDFVVLESEPQAGGNSRWRENEVSRYPWAAHYVPVPNTESEYVRELFTELGVLKDGQFEERYLCFSPQERLYLHGRWQENLEPEVAITRRDKEQFHRFEQLLKEFRATKQFTIPMEIGSSRLSKDLRALDQISMTQWLDQQKLDSEYLRWYVDYSTRDDYGTLAADTSAWAGIQYFAGRENDEKGPLTWPEGNGWILEKLLAKLQRYVRPNAQVYRVQADGSRYRVITEAAEYECETVIFAAPTFLAHYLIEGAPKAQFTYSPWLTANLTLDRWPFEKGMEAAWDNVIYDSPSLGYVVATHMSLRSRIDRTVWTYYYALAEGAPAAMRERLMKTGWNEWKEIILNDLSKAHKDLRQCVSRIDIMRIGHAMARPTPGFLTNGSREQWINAPGRIFYANSDLSGMSIFEEAQYRGVRAAERALKVLGGKRS